MLIHFLLCWLYGCYNDDILTTDSSGSVELVPALSVDTFTVTIVPWPDGLELPGFAPGLDVVDCGLLILECEAIIWSPDWYFLLCSSLNSHNCDLPGLEDVIWMSLSSSSCSLVLCCWKNQMAKLSNLFKKYFA